MIKEIQVVKVHNFFKWYKPICYLEVCIRFFAKTKTNHECLYIRIDDDHLLYEAVLPRVIREDFYQWENKEVRGLDYEVLDPAIYDLEQVYFRAQELLNTKYDWPSLIFDLIYLLSGRTIWIGRKGLKAKRRVTCVEFVEYCKGNPYFYEAIPTN